VGVGGLARHPLFERDGTLPGGLVAGLAVRGRIRLHLPRLQFTSASRMVGLHLPRALRRRARHALHRALGTAVDAAARGLVAAFAGVAWAFAEGFTRPAAGERQWLGDTLGVAPACCGARRRWRSAAAA
jgi:hypothetical protein